MNRWRGKVFGGVAAAALAVFALSASSRAEDPTPAVSSGGEQYRLRLHHLHTGEDIDIVYRVGAAYLPEAMEKLDYFLRDHRTQTVSNYDPREFDVLHDLMAKLRRPNGVIDVVCGYRTPWSNDLLRSQSANSGVAEHSQHMEAKAIDIRVPGVPTARLRDAALSLHDGGVGYYPVNQFVHVDVGPVREWSYGRVSRRRASTHLVARAHRRHSDHSTSG
ncbi:DUF882 domain-containing protein [Edaphobacter bradus]|uniref:DUF882 domain-containing protein n=1 Tax=Edaphobacter bradus TaxID=2259016 RepID=UPI0021E0E4D9|nr:DUF882 domain-containing protein [Edaphobacter bradus]